MAYINKNCKSTLPLSNMKNTNEDHTSLSSILGVAKEFASVSICEPPTSDSVIC